MMFAMQPESRVRRLMDQGVDIPAPQQVFIGAEVVPERVRAGARLLPGARIEGSRTWVSAGAEIGSEGPASARDCVLGPRARLASGSFEGCVLFSDSQLGPSGHGRAGTLLEEHASTAHAVGTKQTILLAFATLGSNINCCDALLAGGTGPKDHSEIGSGFIHFNFTPYGPAGDKATPSLFGDVPGGVWLRSQRIFLGGAGGVVGPVSIGFGTVLAAGSVWRRGRGAGVLALAERLPERDLAFSAAKQGRVREKLLANLRYIGNLRALQGFYRGVRLPLAAGQEDQVAVLQAALVLLSESVEERVKQLARWISGLEGDGEAGRVRANWPKLSANLLSQEMPDAPELVRAHAPASALDFVRSLPEPAVTAGSVWLAGIVAATLAMADPVSD